MNRRLVLIAAAAVAVVALLAWVVLDRRSPGGDDAVVAAVATPTPAPEERIVLLFTGADGLLHPELRPVPLPAEVIERVRVIATEVLAGPGSTELAPVVPWQAEVLAVFTDQRGTAFLDVTAPPGELEGSHLELMLVYGLVDSVLLNCPELKAVQLMFGGRELPTLTGHLDLSEPLVLNKRFIAS